MNFGPSSVSSSSAESGSSSGSDVLPDDPSELELIDSISGFSSSRRFETVERLRLTIETNLFEGG